MVNIYVAPLECSKCEAEMGAVLFDTEECIRHFGDTYQALLCRQCFEDLQQTSMDKDLKWTKLN
jgi:hypothetical protein